MAMAALVRLILPTSSPNKQIIAGSRFSEQTKSVPFFVEHLDSLHSSVKFACFALQFSDYQEARRSSRCKASPFEPFNLTVSTSTPSYQSRKSIHGIQCSRRSVDASSKPFLSHSENAPLKDRQDILSEEENHDDDNSSLGFEDSSFGDVDGSNSYFTVSNRASSNGSAGGYEAPIRESSNVNPSFSVDSVITVKEPIYEVLEVCPGGNVVKKTVSRRQLLKSSGLRLRDVRSVDPSLWVTNSAPALLVRDQAILLNLGSLRAIGTTENVLIFDHKSIGAVLFLEVLLQRLNPESNPGVPTMPFELEVVESALLSRTQRLERRLMEIEPRVLALLEVLPNRLTANVLEELRLSKQALVELGSKAGALRQMLLELLESPQEIRKMTIMGRRCTIKKEDGSIDCTAYLDKQLADDEEEEIEMLLENYLQRCESCHGQAERLLDSAKEMEDSIAVNLSSRRLEVSRLELLLQVGTFCSALGALVAGIFGMNLRSYLETSVVAFWLTTAGIIFGGIILFYLMFNYLKQRKIL